MSYAGIQKLILDIVLAQKMDALWSVINTLQVVEFANLFHTNIPGSLNHFSNFFNDITDFQIFPNEIGILEWIFYIPEMPPISPSFYNAGYMSSLFLISNKPFVMNFAAAVVLIILHKITSPCCKRFSATKKVNSKIGSLLDTNSCLRFYTEVYLQCFIFALLNLRELDTESVILSVKVSNIASYVTVFAGVAIPLGFFLYYYRNRAEWREKEFQAKAFLLLDGAYIEYPDVYWPQLFFMVSFFIRRAMLAITLVFWYDFLLGQVAIQFMLLTFMIILIQWYHPRDCSYANTVETFNEITQLNIIVMLVCFSDF